MSRLEQETTARMSLGELAEQVARALRQAEPGAPRYLWPLAQISELARILETCAAGLRVFGLFEVHPRAEDLLFLIEALIQERKFFPRQLLSPDALYQEDARVLQDLLVAGILQSYRGQVRLESFHRLGMIPGLESFPANERLPPKPECNSWTDLTAGAPPPFFEQAAYQEFAALPQRPLQRRSVCPNGWPEVVCAPSSAPASSFWEGSLRGT